MRAEEKMLENRKRLTIALVLNLLISLFELYAVFMNFIVGKTHFDFVQLQFYTHLSNIFILISSLAATMEITKELCGAVKRTHMAVRILNYMAVCSLTLTLLVVVCVLAPMEGKEGAKFLLFGRTNIFEHIICPVLAFVTFVFFGDFCDIGSRGAVIAVVPTLVYAVVMALLNALGVVDGPYPFLRVQEQGILPSVGWFMIIIGAALGIAELLLWLTRRYNVSRKILKSKI